MTNDEETAAIEKDIATLRKNGSKGALACADDLEIKLVRMRNKLTRIEQLSIERLGEWMDELRADLSSKNLAHGSIDAWGNVAMAADALQALELAWATTSFRIRETAKVLGFPVGVLNAWFDSAAWQIYLKTQTRRVNQVATLADLSISRIAQVLAVDTNDPEIIKLQLRAAEIAFASGLKVPANMPGGSKDGKPSSHKTLPARAEEAPVPKRRKAVTEAKR